MSDMANGGANAGDSRREFLKTSSILIAGGALAGVAGMARTAHAAGDDAIKIALIGCGGRGSGAAAQALRTPGNAKLVVMADVFEDRLESSLADIQKALAENNRQDRVDVPKERRFVGFDAYQKAIDSDVDLVLLTTPPGFRPIHFEAAVKAGKHVFMEKPVATDAPGVRKVLAAAEEAKKKKLAVGVGLQRRHHPAYIETIKRLHDGAIGDLIASRAYWDGGPLWMHKRQPNWTEMEYQMRNWYYFVWLCGDHIVEQHIHNLDVINWAKNAYPTSAHGLGGRQVRTGKDYGQIFDHHTVEYEYADGTKMFSQCHQIADCWESVTEHTHGTKGTANISGHSIHVKGESPWKFRGRTPDPFQQEHDDLQAAIRSGEPYNEAEYGAKSTLTAIMGRMATYSGKLVTWDAALNSKLDLMPEKYAFDAMPKVLPDAEGRYPVAEPGVTVAF